MAATTLRRLSSTSLTAAFVVLALVAASSAARTVGAGRPAAAHLHAAMRATATSMDTKQQPDQTAATIDKAGSSGCSSNPNNGGGRCPGSQSHRQISSGNSNQTTD